MADHRATASTQHPLLDRAAIAALIAQGRQLALPPGRPAAVHGHLGEQTTPRLGDGLDFAEHRPYQPGDDPRRIDWRVTARTGSHYVRRFLDERQPDALLVVDRRATMAFGTRRRLKVTQAVRAAILLMTLYATRGAQVQLLTLDRQVRALPPLHADGLLPASLSLAAPCPPDDHRGAALDEALGWAHRQLPAGADLWVFSDFLHAGPASAWQAAAARYALQLVRVLDPAERDNAPVADVALGWAFDAETWLPPGQAMQADLAARRADAEALLRDACARRVLTLPTDDDSLQPFLQGAV